MAKRFVANFVGVTFLLTATLFAAGAYLLLARSHGLWMLLGAELLLNAPVPLFLQAGSPEAIALVFVTLFFALLEAAAALFLFYHYHRASGSLDLASLPPL
ncbi:MAG: hypothetical protein KatS3mg026_0301 [Bacteroidia bacterium]|nr:MAG: hypothetical protein KatS3mg026_0301 [Bacteroidia bacterium]